MTVREFAEQWRAIQVHRPSTASYTKTMLTGHLYPLLGARPMASIHPSDIQAWVKALTQVLQPSTVGILHGVVAGMFKAAVRDRRIASNPCEGTRLPEWSATDVVPLTVDQVEALAEKIPRAVPGDGRLVRGDRAAPGRVLWSHSRPAQPPPRNCLRRPPDVSRGRVGMYLGPPKTPSSTGRVPLAPGTFVELARHLAAFPPRVQSIRLADGHGQPCETFEDVRLVFTGGRGAPVRRSGFGADVWRPTVKKASVPEGVGFHQLRHFYASALIAYPRMDPKTVQARMRHATLAETYDTYGHLMPDSEDRTRDAISAAFARSATADGDTAETAI